MIALSLLTNVSCFTIKDLLIAEIWYPNTPLLKTCDLYETLLRALPKISSLLSFCMKYAAHHNEICLSRWHSPFPCVDRIRFPALGKTFRSPDTRFSACGAKLRMYRCHRDLPETNLSPQSRSESWCSHQAIFRQYTVAPLDEKEAFERSDYQVGAKVDRDLISSSSPLSFTRGGVLDQLMGPPWSPSTGSAFSALPSQWTNSSRGIVTAQILLLLLPRLTQHFPWNLTENNL